MPDSQFRTASGALVEATAAQARMANSTIHLLKDVDGVTPGSSLTYLEAREADYDGYAPITMATWNAPILGATSGYLTYGPQVSFLWVFDTDAVGNSIKGFWTQTAGGALMDIVIFGDPFAMQGPGNAIVQTPVQVFPARAV